MASSQTEDSINIGALRQYIGRQRVAEDTLTLRPARALAVTLDQSNALLQEGDPLPLPWHWLYFQSLVATSDLGVDGHPPKGGFLPPVPLPRRMWAGGALEVFEPLRVGQRIRCLSTVVDVTHKTGSSGDLIFVAIRHDYSADDQLLLRERQDLVYRSAAVVATPPAQPAAPQHHWSATCEATNALLFRYSALTFNTHRIHYDLDYAVHKEGYAGLVVQGPLCVTLLLQQLSDCCDGKPVAQFSYRNSRPLIANSVFFLRGRITENRGAERAQLWICDQAGAITMRADAAFEACA